MKPLDRKEQNAVARIIAGESRPEDEAPRLNVDARTIRRWVKAHRDAMAASRPKPPESPEKGPSENVNPQGPDAEKPKNDALDEALKAAGEKPDAPKPGTVTTNDQVLGREDMERFCIRTIEQLKMATGGAIVTFRYSPPLQLTDAKVQEALKVSPVADAAIRANAERLYPVLVKMMAGPYQLAAALALDGIFMLVALSGLAKERGWVAPEKGKEKQEREEVRDHSPLRPREKPAAETKIPGADKPPPWGK